MKGIQLEVGVRQRIPTGYAVDVRDSTRKSFGFQSSLFVFIFTLIPCKKPEKKSLSGVGFSAGAHTN